MKRKVPLLLILIVAIFLITVIPNLIFVFTAPDQSVVGKIFSKDDPYYYFQIARNIASGYGSSFDQITQTNGYHPLWMLICIPIFSLTKINLIFPLRIILLISSILHFGSITLLMLAFKKVGINYFAGFSSVLLFLLSPKWNTFIVSGSEMVLNLFLLCLLIYLLTPDLKEDLKSMHLYLLGITTGLLFLARLDNLFVIISVSILILRSIMIRFIKSYRLKIAFGVKYLLPLTILVCSYITYNQLNYGKIIPISGQVKMYWASLNNSIFGLPSKGFLESINIHFSTEGTAAVFGPVASLFSFLSLKKESWIILMIVIFFLIFGLFQKKTSLRPLFFLLVASSIIHTFYYAFVGYVQHNLWYWVVEYTTVILFLALGIHGLLTLFKKKHLQLAISIMVLLFIILMYGPQYYSYILNYYRYFSTDGEYYFSRAQFLVEKTPENAIIGTPNAGALGYFTNRHIVNIDGLANSYEFFESIKDQKSHFYLKQIGVNHIFISPGYIQHEPYKSMLEGNLKYIECWTNSNGKGRHDLFQYNIK